MCYGDNDIPGILSVISELNTGNSRTIKKYLRSDDVDEENIQHFHNSNEMIHELSVYDPNAGKVVENTPFYQTHMEFKQTPFI